MSYRKIFFGISIGVLSGTSLYYLWGKYKKNLHFYGKKDEKEQIQETDIEEVVECSDCA